MISGMLAEAAKVALLAAQEGDAPAWLLALGPAGAGAVYFGVWRFYRNTHQSHSFEHETRIESKPVTGHDAKVGEITGTKQSRIDNGNDTDHRKRVQRSN